MVQDIEIHFNSTTDGCFSALWPNFVYMGLGFTLNKCVKEGYPCPKRKFDQ